MFEIVKINKIKNIKIITVKIVWFAANPSPTAMAINKYNNSSGSFMGVLNLTIDKAPTRPKDNASEDFTIEITRKTVSANIGSKLENWNLFDHDFEKFK